MKTKKIKVHVDKSRENINAYFTSESSSILDTWDTILDIESRYYNGDVSSAEMSFDFINDEDVINKIDEVKEDRESDYDYIDVDNNHIDMSVHDNSVIFDILDIFPPEYIINNIDYNINIMRE